MRKTIFLKVAIALCLALLLFACEINPGGGGAGGQNGNSGNNGTGGEGGNGGDKKEYPVKIKLVEVGETFFTVEWNALPGENIIYGLTYSSSLTSHTGRQGYQGSGTRCTVKELFPGETYYMSIVQMDPDGKKGDRKSDVFTVTTASPSLPDITGFKAVATAYDITLSWDNLPGLGVYLIRDLNLNYLNGYRQRVYTSNNSVPLYKHDDPAHIYKVKMMVCSNDGKRASAFTEAINIALKPATLPLPEVAVNVTSYEISASWPTLSSEHLMLSTIFNVRSGVSYELREGGTSSTFELNGPFADAEYKLDLQVIDPVTGEASPVTMKHSLKIPAPEMQGTPGGFKLLNPVKLAKGGYKYTFTLAWDGLPEAEEYYIYREGYDGTLYPFAKSKTAEYTYSGYLNFDSLTLYVKAVNHTTKKGSALSAPLIVNKPK